MPIKGVSDARILPRLGKIRLGVKVERPDKNPYPQATDYFVCPPEVQAVFGEKPKTLQIMFPSNDMEQVARQYLRCYGQTFGLVCWGDGEKCRRKVDTATGDLAGRNTKDWAWSTDMTCDYEECPEYGARCRRVMNLMFMLPDVPGLGVWQIDTSSFYSIREINSTLGIITNLTKTHQFPEGRIAFIPLTLAVGPLEVSPRGTGKKTVYIMHIRSDVKLADVVKKAMLPPGRVIVPEPEIEEAPDDLFPPELLEVQEREPSEPTPPPDEDLFGLVVERQELWTAIRKLMGEVHVNEKAARSYFANVCDVSVALEELAKETVPPALTIHMLKEFQQKLEQSRMNLG